MRITRWMGPRVVDCVTVAPNCVRRPRASLPAFCNKNAVESAPSDHLTVDGRVGYTSILCILFKIRLLAAHVYISVARIMQPDEFSTRVAMNPE